MEDIDKILVRNSQKYLVIYSYMVRHHIELRTFKEIKSDSLELQGSHKLFPL
jgi:hypothetical protein